MLFLLLSREEEPSLKTYLLVLAEILADQIFHQWQTIIFSEKVPPRGSAAETTWIVTSGRANDVHARLESLDIHEKPGQERRGWGDLGPVTETHQYQDRLQSSSRLPRPDTSSLSLGSRTRAFFTTVSQSIIFLSPVDPVMSKHYAG